MRLEDQILWYSRRASASLRWFRILKMREKHLWMARAGCYAGAEHPDQMLAERIESVIYAEHGRWVIAQESAYKGKDDLAK
jgi:hypothetical protein